MFLFPVTNQALRVSPLEVDWAISDLKSPLRVSIYNNQSEPAAIDIRFFERVISESGEESLKATADFEWHPRAIKLLPGQSESVTVHWKAPSVPTQEKAYRFVLEQLPIRFQKGPTAQPSQLVLLHKVIGSLYVTPSKGVPQLEVEARQKGGQLHLLIENSGTRRLVLAEPKLKLRRKAGDGEKDEVISGSALTALDGLNVLAGSRRSVVIPWKESGGEVIHAELLP